MDFPSSNLWELGCGTLIVACFIDAGVRVAYVASLRSLWVALTFFSFKKQPSSVKT